MVCRNCGAREALSAGAAKVRLEDSARRSMALPGAARLIPFEECQRRLKAS